MDKESLTRKNGRLIGILRDAESVLVAFSGGVDSAFLLAVAHETLGERAVAATAISEIYPKRETDGAVKFTRDRGIKHVLFQTDEMNLSAFVSNGPDRCYHCKRALFEKLVVIAQEKGIKYVAHAANMDDLGDYRPGLRAAKEMEVMAPLVDASLTKEEIRFLSKEMGLSTWDKPAMACLATRIPYGSAVTAEKLKMIEQSEAFLFDKGIRQCRVRHHGSVARIEVEGPGLRMIMGDDLRKAIVRKFREIGFLHIAVDLEGYVSGSMNRGLEAEAKSKGQSAESFSPCAMRHAEQSDRAGGDGW